MIDAFVLTWCALFISSGGVLHCANTEYDVFDTTTQAIQRYDMLDWRQRNDSRLLRVKEFGINSKYEIDYSTK